MGVEGACDPERTSRWPLEALEEEFGPLGARRGLPSAVRVQMDLEAGRGAEKEELLADEALEALLEAAAADARVDEVVEAELSAGAVLEPLPLELEASAGVDVCPGAEAMEAPRLPRPRRLSKLA